MDRRGFFATLAALVAAPFLPESKPTMVFLKPYGHQTITLPMPQPGEVYTLWVDGVWRKYGAQYCALTLGRTSPPTAPALPTALPR